MYRSVLYFGIGIAALSAWLYRSGGPSKAPMLLFPIAMLVLIGPMVFKRERARRQRLARLGEALDAGTARLRAGPLTAQRVEGQFLGRTARLLIRPAARRPDDVIAQLACASPLRFTFWKPVQFVLGGGINRFQVNDAQLEREFSFISPDPERARSWFLIPENKERVVALLRRGGTGTALRGKRGFLSFEICRSDLMKLNEFREVLQSLAHLAVSLEQSALAAAFRHVHTIPNPVSTRLSSRSRIARPGS